MIIDFKCQCHKIWLKPRPVNGKTCPQCKGDKIAVIGVDGTDVSDGVIIRATCPTCDGYGVV